MPVLLSPGVSRKLRYSLKGKRAVEAPIGRELLQLFQLNVFILNFSDATFVQL